MASSSTFPSSVLNWQPIHQFKNKIMSWNPARHVRVMLIMMNLLEVIWFDQVDLHTSPVTHTCNLDDLVFVIWIPKRLRLTGFCYVELLQRLLQQKFLSRPQRSYFFLNNMESQAAYIYIYHAHPCTVSDSWDCLNSSIETERSFIQISKSFVMFCSSPGLEIWILIPRQRNHYQAQHVLERCNFHLWKKLLKMIVNFNWHKVSYTTVKLTTNVIFLFQMKLKTSNPG